MVQSSYPIISFGRGAFIHRVYVIRTMSVACASYVVCGIQGGLKAFREGFLMCALQ